MPVKFGLKQVNNPAPLIYRRFVNALIIFAIPATATYITQFPTEVMTMETKVVLGLSVNYILALLKGVEYFLGETTKENEDK